MSFWIVTFGLAALAAALLIAVLIRPRGDVVSRADQDIAIYRDQLKELDREIAEGLVTPESADHTRAEISRRILAADASRKQSGNAEAPIAATRAAVATTALVVVIGTAGTYFWLGAPGYGDLPRGMRMELSQEMRENRPSQSEAEAQIPDHFRINAEPDPEHVALVERLRNTMSRRPDDPEGWALLAQNEAALGNYRAAYQAQAQLIELLGDDATAADFSDQAEMLVLAAGGYVSPEAERALSQALERDPHSGPARYFLGLLHQQTGRPDLAFRTWNTLLQSSDPNAPWVASIRSQIEDTAARAGIRFQLQDAPATPALRGPSSEEMQAAGDMTPEDRQTMIEGMVGGLADRLANNGGTPEEWAQLLRALGILDRQDEAQDIWAEAQQVFAGDSTALTILKDAATAAGVSQ
ncbi:c-type cytochrome biogenesis protein CcmI [Qingshengfaniella alkalisoli]|uniref:C-type cytochrome biogenesis protein CcmI n=2 Tax=Qingshengfaniella alkalisoli TaxID=2599296 RepID=A0A5B8IVV3_9RHOB|nr:c-type cytochrome biogenesis protein CcmI [Qingshengfaniella alkalisoli]